MENFEDKIEKGAVAIWEVMKSLNDVKDCTANDKEMRRNDLMALQRLLMEAATWIESAISE